VSGDYTHAKLLFKVRKAARYVSLYGLSKTLCKIRGQYHMKAKRDFAGSRWHNPACRVPDAADRNIAIIGCGNFAYSHIAYYLKKHNAHFLRCTYDRNRNRALSLCKAYGGGYAVSDWQAILHDDGVNLVYIASNHASHTDYAIACMEAGKHVHIEKPHVVSHAQLEQLLTAMRRYPAARVFLGFNRPKSRLFERLQDAVRQQHGPIMINWFVAGHEIADGHWYYDQKEGGRVLGNLCHWTDLTLQLVTVDRAFPCTIVPATPTGAKSDFVVAINFADESCAAITFSAKGHTFEGVRETLNLHRGNLLANLSDFHTLTVDVEEKKRRIRVRHRDHGHEANIANSYYGAVGEKGGESALYVSATAKLFLAVKDAIDSGKTRVLTREEAFGTAPEHKPGLTRLAG
jgi:predicted dehydrogenase